HYELVEKTDSVREIVKKNNLSKKETIFIGDTDYEIQVGKDVGIISAGVTWGAHYEDRLKAVNPDYLFHNLKEMEEVILKT
ncbi:HAD hydrolase-like protein, partial [Patescibacteria group bacterium]|nr:HAD hydrolase-like protein [Patescibacteria group bacterium]